MFGSAAQRRRSNSIPPSLARSFRAGRPALIARRVGRRRRRKIEYRREMRGARGGESAAGQVSICQLMYLPQ